MTLRISKFAVVYGLGLLALPGVVQAQAPRYQSPLSVPATPQPQLTLPTPAPITPNGTVVEDVIVRVNDQIINRTDLERSAQQLQQEIQQGASPADAAERQKNLLRDMIDQQLLLSRGKELGLNADAEVIRRLDEIRKQNHLDSMEDLEKAARQQGVSFEDFKANIKNGVITQQVVRDEVGRRLQMTQGKEQAYYEAHKQEFAQPEQVRLSEILVPTPADANDATVAQAQAKADDISAKVKAGGKFDELAKTYSGGPTASQGGELGLFKRGALAKVLEDQTFSLQSGEATAPIRTRQGFVILKVTEHIAAGVPALKDIEPQIQEAMYMQAMQPALRAYLTKLREGAYIDIAQGFVDSGASPKQTKPVYTAYSAPVVKKKKEQQKQRFDRGGR
jgi:peptidyl-prolyl cis-trans isomerase SurA